MATLSVLAFLVFMRVLRAALLGPQTREDARPDHVSPRWLFEHRREPERRRDPAVPIPVSFGRFKQAK